MKDWQDWLKKIQAEFRNNSEGFLRKPNIRRTVHPSNGGKNIFELVKSHKYFYLIADPKIGKPDLRFGKTHSKTAIESLYHIIRMQEHLNFNPEDLDVVTDIGAGYGHLSYAFRKCNFKGTYNCIDFSVMHEMQKYFLEKSGVTLAKFLDLDQLDTIEQKENSLIFGSYSINEMPIEDREKIEPFYKDYKYIMIIYKNNSDFGVNNAAYFNSLKNKLQQSHNTKIINDQYYKNDLILFASKK